MPKRFPSGPTKAVRMQHSWVYLQYCGAKTMTEKDKTITPAGEVELDVEDLDQVRGGMSIKGCYKRIEPSKPTDEITKTIGDQEVSLDK